MAGLADVAHGRLRLRLLHGQQACVCPWLVSGAFNHGSKTEGVRESLLRPLGEGGDWSRASWARGVVRTQQEVQKCLG